MRVRIDYARDQLEVEVADGAVLNLDRQPVTAPLDDPVEAVRAGLEEPLGFPALRRALTPDDHVTVVVDQQIPGHAGMLGVIFEHIGSAGVPPTAVTILCGADEGGQPWIHELPNELGAVQVEVHDPTDRKRLSYLATTRSGRRIYLNRSVVDADQLVVLSRRGYDPVLGYGGAEGTIFPAFSDAETRQELLGRISLAVPGESKWPARVEAGEVAWLLGAPFMVQIIEGAGDSIAHVVCGTIDSGPAALRLLDARWRVATPRLADTVVVSLSGDVGRHDFAELARAVGCAARVCQPNGRIVAVSAARLPCSPALELLRQAEGPDQALKDLREYAPLDAAAFQWANAARQATIYLLGSWPTDTAEELFAVPLENPGQLQRLLASSGTCLFVPDAHKTMAVIA